jgi:hypothetical protein
MAHEDDELFNFSLFVAILAGVLSACASMLITYLASKLEYIPAGVFGYFILFILFFFLILFISLFNYYTTI